MASKGIFWVVLAGGVTGAAAIYMYTTKNGRAMRKDIKRKKDILIDRTNDVLNEGKEKAKSFLKEAKKHTDTISQEISKVSENYLVPAKKKTKNYKRPY